MLEICFSSFFFVGKLNFYLSLFTCSDNVILNSKKENCHTVLEHCSDALCLFIFVVLVVIYKNLTFFFVHLFNK